MLAVERHALLYAKTTKCAPYIPACLREERPAKRALVRTPLYNSSDSESHYRNARVLE